MLDLKMQNSTAFRCLLYRQSKESKVIKWCFKWCIYPFWKFIVYMYLVQTVKRFHTADVFTIVSSFFFPLEK